MRLQYAQTNRTASANDYRHPDSVGKLRTMSVVGGSENKRNGGPGGKRRTAARRPPDEEESVSRKGRSLRPEERERVRGALLKLLESHTQTQLKELFGFSQSQISSVLNGRSGASVFFAMRVAEVAGLAPGELVDFAGGETHVPEMSAREFISWIYQTPGLAEATDRHRDITIQDVFRLRASPMRNGETASPEEIYKHIQQLRGASPAAAKQELMTRKELLSALPATPSSRPTDRSKRKGT